MNDELYVKLLEHNNWANEQIIQACYALSDVQLDAESDSATKGTIRQTLNHLVSAQRGYLGLLTRPVEERVYEPLAFAELPASARESGEGLLALAREAAGRGPAGQIRSSNGYLIEPWVVMVQVINHATEHREQIKSMLSALGLEPPSIDGWTFGEATDAVMLS